MTGRPGLSFVIPALNEAEGISATLDAVGEVAAQLAATIGAVEVIVVDDGSTDATAEVVASRAATDPGIRLLQHPRRRGLGAAVRTGFAATMGEVVCYTDADLPFDLSEVHGALALMDDPAVGVVSLCRRNRGGEGPRRWVYSWSYNSLVRLALDLRVRDVNFAGKLVRRSLLEQLELRSEGSFIDAELLARAVRAGAGIAQAEVDYHPRSRGVSTLSSTAVIVQMLGEMRALRPEIVASGPPRRGGR